MNSSYNNEALTLDFPNCPFGIVILSIVVDPLGVVCPQPCTELNPALVSESNVI